MRATQLKFVEPNEVRMYLPPGAANLRIEIVGQLSVLAGKVRRVFPLSSPNSFFSLQDASGQEVAVLRTAEGLDGESKQILEREIDRRYFTPKISRIVSLKQEGGMWTWNVETSRGDIEFFVRSWRDSSYEISAGRFQIQSVDGQRFEIPSYDKLDDRSKAFIEQLF